MDENVLELKKEMLIETKRTVSVLLESIAKDKDPNVIEATAKLIEAANKL